MTTRRRTTTFVASPYALSADYVAVVVHPVKRMVLKVKVHLTMLLLVIVLELMPIVMSLQLQLQLHPIFVEDCSPGFQG